MNKGFFINKEKNEYIKESLEKRLAKYGKMNFVYSVMNKRNSDEMMIISDLSEELIIDYLKNKTQEIDPVIINASNRVSPFSWDEDLKINYQWTVKRVFEPIKPYNIISGYAFVLHDQNNYLAVLSLYIDKLLMNEVEENIKNSKDEIQGILIFIHEILLQSYRDELDAAQHTLSSRETEILYWCSLGKTYPEIAKMLQLAVSTIKFHMANIVKKLGVRNAKHAVTLAKELNIIPHPSAKKG